MGRGTGLYMLIMPQTIIALEAGFGNLAKFDLAFVLKLIYNWLSVHKGLVCTEARRGFIAHEPTLKFYYHLSKHISF